MRQKLKGGLLWLSCRVFIVCLLIRFAALIRWNVGLVAWLIPRSNRGFLRGVCIRPVSIFVLHQKLSTMATLSKMVIENIASRMTEQAKNHSNFLNKEYKELATEMYEASLPKEVFNLFKTDCEYMKTTSSIQLDGNGFNRESISLSKCLPAKSGYGHGIKFTAANCEKLIKAKRKYEKAKEDYDLLLRETQSALAALKTERNIRENLPEAIPFLPPPMSNSLVVNFKSLQKKLNSQPESPKVVA